MRFHPAVPRASSVFLAAFLLAAPAWAGWGTTPVTVRATAAAIPVVSACNDGGFGTFVAWQEESSPGSGQLRVSHLLPTGDPDPAWPADGALACVRSVSRPTIAALPDHLGGVYLWWIESTTLYVTRLQPDGSAASGWPVDGLGLGTLWGAAHRPSGIEDASHGIYLAWTTGATVRAHHLGPNGLGAQGWPNAPRTIVPSDAASSFQLWPDLALSPDGGAYVSWATWSQDTTIVESSMRLRRLTPAGLDGAGWSSEGLVLGPFRPEPLGQMPLASLLDISPDGRGGVFAHIGVLQEMFSFVDTRLYRIASNGSTDPEWPVAGYLIKADATYYNGTQPGTADGGLRVHLDPPDRAIVEFQNPYSDSPASVGVSQVSNLGVLSWPKTVIALGHETVVRPGGGGFYAADFKCCGPASQWDWPAMLGLHAEPDGSWSSRFEVHSEPLTSWYGDIALASTGDGGVVYFWSQQSVSLGLFARRFNPTQEVTAVGPPSGRPSLSALRFVAGSGIAAHIELEGDVARLELFDVSGRRLATRSISGAGAFDVMLPGTASLRSGMYFARLRTSGMSPTSKVVVAR